MAYSPPSFMFYQEYVRTLLSNTLPLAACILAPRYDLHRYGTEGEEALLGAYVKATGNTYTEWPDRVEDASIVDIEGSAVWVKDPVVQYCPAIGGASVEGLVTNFAVNKGNKIRMAALVLQTANGYDRSAVFGTRDVAVGDYIQVANITTPGVFTGKVAGFEADVVAATVAATTEPTTGNTATKGPEAKTVVSSDLDTEYVFSFTGSTYNGLEGGVPEETYTCEVLETDGGLTGTIVSVTSASGTDDVAELILAASGVANVCGTRGAKFIITESTGGDDIAVGDTFVLKYTMLYTHVIPAKASGSAYLGVRNTTYIVEITNGGKIDTDVDVAFKVTSTNGYDSALATVVAAAGDYPVGNYGVSLTFTAAQQYCTGDRFLIVVTAAGEAQVRTVVMSSYVTVASGADELHITLGLYPADIALDDAYWATADDSIVIAANARVTEDYLGASQAFNILSGDLYMDYRELITSTQGVLESVADPLLVADQCGATVLANPLGLLTYAAAVKAAGTPVYYMNTGGNALADYEACLDVLTEVPETWGLVPFSEDTAILSAVEAHVDYMSGPAVAMFRTMWRGVSDTRINAYYTELSDGSEILASSVTGDLTSLNAASATFVINEVRVGDTVRYNYSVGNRGQEVYDSYRVVEVTADTVLKISPALSSAVVTPIKMEVWRTDTVTEYAARLAAVPASYANMRVRCICSDTLSFNGEVDLPKSVLAALVAGYRSALAPHQPLTNVELNGNGLDITSDAKFGATQLNTMAAAGMWMVVKDTAGSIYTRHQLTTDMSDPKTREDSVVDNVDHVCRDIKDSIGKLYGKGNAGEGMLKIISARVTSRYLSILSRNYPDEIGPQLLSFQIAELYVDTVNRDQVYVTFDATYPEPMNKLTARMRVI